MTTTTQPMWTASALGHSNTCDGCLALAENAIGFARAVGTTKHRVVDTAAGHEITVTKALVLVPQP